MKIHTVSELNAAFRGAAPGEHLEIAEGVYRTKSEITVPGLSIEGEGAERTSIVWGDAAKDLDEAGRELVTFRTYTLAVTADHVSMKDIAVINDAGSPEKRGQQVALSVYGDDFCMENSAVSSTQDTLFLGPLPPDLIDRYEGFLCDRLRKDIPCRMRFRNCLIEGTVDFVFGCGEAIFTDCELRSVFDVRGVGYVAAPAHSLSQKSGFSFINCVFSAENSVAGKSIYLARPWRDYGMAVFTDCTYGKHICPEGFDPWQGTRRDRTARFYETPFVSGRVPFVNPPDRD